jgi:hypothetical protein
MMILAYAAACHGEKQKTPDHLSHYQKLFKSRTAKPEIGNIEELGWALRASMRFR